MGRFSLLPLAAACLALGCMAPDIDDAESSGGSGSSGYFYNVHAVLMDSTCGVGALGAPELWDFTIKLRRDDETLYWNSGADAVEGTIEGNSFKFESQTTMQLAKTGPRGVGCVVTRTDRATGTFKEGADGQLEQFEGDLRYDFTPQAESDCAEAALEQGFYTLPCQMHYEMAAVRAGS